MVRSRVTDVPETDATAKSRPIRRARLPQTLTGRRRVARRIDRVLAQRYPDARCELDFRDPYELLVATVLSAQTTDVRVNLVTPLLFAKYPDALALAGAQPDDVEKIIASTGFFRAKTRSLLGLAAGLVERFDGAVPSTMEGLVSLPGVGRKTANVVLGDAFGIPGITVDTHFGRLARRFGWTTSDDPIQVETDVATLFEKRDWTMLSHHLIFHGRRTCHARRPACGACPVAAMCPAYGEGEIDPDEAAKLIRTGPPR